MQLSEIIQNINLNYFIDISDPSSLSNIYTVDNSQLQGSKCVGNAIAEMFARGYELSIQDVIPLPDTQDFTTGPEKTLEIHYKTKVINEIALKYKIYTENGALSNLDTWEGYLKPNIFFSIINSAKTMNKLTDFDLEEHIPTWKKENPDQTVTHYKYDFYPSEKPEWANPERLTSVGFKDGYILLKIKIPVKETMNVPETKEI